MKKFKKRSCINKMKTKGLKKSEMQELKGGISMVEVMSAMSIAGIGG